MFTSATCPAASPRSTPGGDCEFAVWWTCPPRVVAARMMVAPVTLPVSQPGMAVMRLTILANPRGLTASQRRGRMRAIEDDRETPRVGVTAQSAARARSKPKQRHLGAGRPAPTKREFGQPRPRICRTITDPDRMDNPRQQTFPGSQSRKALRAKRHVYFLRGPLWSSFFLRVKKLLLAMARTPGTAPVRHAPQNGATPARPWFGNGIENPERPTDRPGLSPRLPIRRPAILLPTSFGPPMTSCGNRRYRSPIMTTSPKP